MLQLIPVSKGFFVFSTYLQPGINIKLQDQIVDPTKVIDKCKTLNIRDKLLLFLRDVQSASHLKACIAVDLDACDTVGNTLSRQPICSTMLILLGDLVKHACAGSDESEVGSARIEDS